MNRFNPSPLNYSGTNTAEQTTDHQNASHTSDDSTRRYGRVDETGAFTDVEFSARAGYQHGSQPLKEVARR